MGINLESLRWGSHAKREEKPLDPLHLGSLKKALDRVKGGERVPHAALEAAALKVAPDVEALEEKGEKVASSVKAALKGMLSHLPTYSMPTADAAYEKRFEEAEREGSDMRTESYG